MEETKNDVQEQKEELLYSEKDYEELKAKLESEFLEKQNLFKAEMEQEAKKANMSELELARAEIEELKQKYQEKEDECLIARQKEETNILLREAGLDASVLELVYVSKDMDKTKQKIEMLKSCIENVKKDAFQNCSDTPLPLTSGKAQYDAFIEGFDTNTL